LNHQEFHWFLIYISLFSLIKLVGLYYIPFCSYFPVIFFYITFTNIGSRLLATNNHFSLVTKTERWGEENAALWLANRWLVLLLASIQTSSSWLQPYHASKCWAAIFLDTGNYSYVHPGTKSPARFDWQSITWLNQFVETSGKELI